MSTLLLLEITVVSINVEELGMCICESTDTNILCMYVCIYTHIHTGSYTEIPKDIYVPVDIRLESSLNIVIDLFILNVLTFWESISI